MENVLAVNFEEDTKAYAAFGDVIWRVNDKLNLTAGLRYTRDEKDFTWFNDLRSAPELDAQLNLLDAVGFLDAIGIPKEALKNLGKPFEQVENQLTKTHRGSGLGLAIAKSLSELHGGAMRIRSSLGVGTIVLVRLPVDDTPLPHAAEDAQPVH